MVGFAQIEPNRCLHLQTHPGWPETPLFAHLGALRAYQSVFISVQNQALWAHVLAKNGPKTAETRPDSD